jgi:hypothetical protein
MVQYKLSKRMLNCSWVNSVMQINHTSGDVERILTFQSSCLRVLSSYWAVSVYQLIKKTVMTHRISFVLKLHLDSLYWQKTPPSVHLWRSNLFICGGPICSFVEVQFVHLWRSNLSIYLELHHQVNTQSHSGLWRQVVNILIEAYLKLNF